MIASRPLSHLVRATCVLLAVVAGLPASAWAQDAAETQPAEGETVKLTRPNTFTVNFQGTDLRLALRLLSTEGRRNIVASREVQGKVTATLYNVTFKEALEAVLSSAGFASVEKDNMIHVMTPQQYEAYQQSQKRMTVKPFTLSYLTAADAKSLLSPALSDAGTITVTPAAAVGIASSKSEAGGNSYSSSDVILVRDYEERIERIAALVEQLDVKPRQVLIEATILRTVLDENNALGVDFNSLAGIDFQGLDTTSAGLTDATTGTVQPTGLPNNGSASTIRTDFNSAIGSGGVSIGFMTNEIAFFIRALESVTDLSVVANPKLLVANKQRGEVMVGNRDGYLTTTFTETTATQSVAFLETGTRLIVRPFVAKDGLIRMEIHPEQSSGSIQEVAGSALPSETTVEVTSNVLVRDGHTIVIGGLFRETTSAGRSQVPLLGNVPYVGGAFRRTTDETVREEIIILITPHIIKQAAAEAVGSQVKAEIERIRIGNRKGLRWWGRNRLAQEHLRAAKQHLRAGKVDRALWDLDMALSMDPKMLEAIRLKERLTHKAYWANEVRGASTRFLMERVLLQEQGIPFEPITPPDRPERSTELDPQVRELLGIEPRPSTTLRERGEYDDGLGGMRVRPANGGEHELKPIEADPVDTVEPTVRARDDEDDSTPPDAPEPEAADDEPDPPTTDGEIKMAPADADE